MKNNKIYYENLKKVNFLPFKEFKKKISKFELDGQYILGKNTLKFENNFSKFLKIKYCVGVNSGLDALIIALETLGLKKGDQVLVQSNAYIASILSIVRLGLEPILIEPDLETYNFDIKNCTKISNKTKAIIVTHLYGLITDMDIIKKFCKKHNLFLIEDCAQSHGAMYLNKYAGTFGDISCFSFYPTKNLGGVGDGGAIVTNNQNYYKKVKIIRNYGFIKKNYSKYLGLNSRLDEIQSVFLNIKLKYLKKINSKKIKLANLYDKYLSNYFIKPKVKKNFQNIFHIYPIRVKEKERNKLIKYLKNKNIDTSIHYPLPVHKQKCFEKIKFFKKKYPISELIHNTILSLPISFQNTTLEILKVIKVMNDYAKIQINKKRKISYKKT